MSPQHGDYDPQYGWFDASRGGWIRDPSKLGREVPGQRAVTEQDRIDYQRQQARLRGEFRPDATLDRLLALRDSDRADDRARFEQLARGSTRVSLQQYERAKAEHEARQQA